MLPNVADVLLDWEQTVKVKTVTRSTVDFVSTSTVSVANAIMVVQPADPKTLTADNIDWSLRHLTFHSRTQLSVAQVIEYKSTDFKLIQVRNYSDYGYWEAVGVETQRALLT